MFTPKSLQLVSVLAILMALAGCKTTAQQGLFTAPPSHLPGNGGAYRLDESGQWVPPAPPHSPPLTADEATITHARALLARDEPAQARRILDRWIAANEFTSPPSPLLPQAYLLRGDAVLAAGNEYTALYDYEKVILDFPGSPEYARAVERELEIGIRYLNGLRRKFWGMRIAGATDIGEELLVRVQERLPGSTLAEHAGIELADYYYRTRDLAAASEAYEVFIVNHPRSEHATKARQRRIYANIARFKGPDYDASGLTEAQVLIEEYAAIDPIGAQRAGLTDALSARLEESAAAQQLQKARWYLRRGDAVSARFMLHRVAEAHPRTVSADLAMQMLEARGWGSIAIPTPAPTPGGPTSPETPG
jgi:tetratricopeptide (TPR) repeat protein